MADNANAIVEENPMLTRERLRIRFVVCFDMGVFAVVYYICMAWVFQLHRMKPRYENGTLVKLPPFDLSPTSTGYLTLGAAIIDLMIKMTLLALFFIATSKSNHENNPKRCVNIIVVALLIYFCHVMEELGWLYQVIYPAVVVAVKGKVFRELNTIIFVCAPVYDLVFLILLYTNACTFIKYLPHGFRFAINAVGTYPV